MNIASIFKVLAIVVSLGGLGYWGVHEKSLEYKQEAVMQEYSSVANNEASALPEVLGEETSDIEEGAIQAPDVSVDDLSRSEVKEMIREAITSVSTTTVIQNNYISRGGSADGLANSVGRSNSTLQSNIDQVNSNSVFDTSAFTVDATNDRVGIGTTSPYAKLAISQPTPEVIGSELITNGSFTGNADGWTLESGCADYSNNSVTVNFDAGCMAGAYWARIYTTIAVTAGSTYKVTFTVSNATDDVYYFLDSYIFWSSNFSNGTHTAYINSNHTGTYTLSFESWDWLTNAGWTIDDVSVKEVSAIPESLVVNGYDGVPILSIGRDTYENTALGRSVLVSNITGHHNTAIGDHSLYSNTTGYNNTAIGDNSLYSNTTGNYNTAVGISTLYLNTTGRFNTTTGNYSLYYNSTGSYNTASGIYALSANYTGSNNVAVGDYSSFYNRSATNTVAVGYESARGTASYSNQGGTYLGYQSGRSASTGSNYNTLLGYQSGYGVTTGANNILIGALAGYSGTNLTTGSNNIIIGYNIGATSTSMSYGMNIGNILFGTNIDGTGTTLSTGNIGIGTTTPWKKLSVNGGVALPALGNDSTGYYVCLNTTTGNLATSTSACGASSEKYKENIVDLSYGLEDVMKLRAVSFDYKENYISNGKRQLGFIAEEVDLVIPELVARDGEGEIQGLDYPKFAAVLVRAIQELVEKVDALTEQMKESIVAIKDLVLESLTAKTISTDELNIHGQVCVDNICMTKDQFKEMMLRSGVGAVQIIEDNSPFLDQEVDISSSTPITSTTTEEIIEDITSTTPEVIEGETGESQTELDL